MSEISWEQAIIKVLEKSSEPMRYAEIADKISADGIRKSLGATPAATVVSVISQSIKKNGNNSPFIRLVRGTYWLREHGDNVEDAGNENDEIASEAGGLIRAFGMYWDRSEIHWGQVPKVLGRQVPSEKSVDFSKQTGVYLLYDGRSVVYVGRTIKSLVS